MNTVSIKNKNTLKFGFTLILLLVALLLSQHRWNAQLLTNGAGHDVVDFPVSTQNSLLLIGRVEQSRMIAAFA